MQINTNYNSPTFGKFFICKSAVPALKKLSKAEIVQIGKWQKELGNTEIFDLFLRKNFDDSLELQFLHNGDCIPRHNSDAPLEAIKVNGKTVTCSAYDGNDDWTYYSLEYPTTKRAHEVFDVLNAHSKNNDTLFNRIAWAVDAVKSLEESYVFMGFKAGKEKVIDIIRRYHSSKS